MIQSKLGSNKNEDKTKFLHKSQLFLKIVIKNEDRIENSL